MGVGSISNTEAVAKINKELYTIRKELDAVDAVKIFPNAFNPLTDKLPGEHRQGVRPGDCRSQKRKRGRTARRLSCDRKYFNFLKPKRTAEGRDSGRYGTNMVAQLKQLRVRIDPRERDAVDPARVRLDAGLPPLVTLTSGSWAPRLSIARWTLKTVSDVFGNVSNQFVNLVKGEYGETPVPVDPEFRLKIAGGARGNPVRHVEISDATESGARRRRRSQVGRE